LEKILKKARIRTLSGVSPIAVLTKPAGCPGKCVFCPTEERMPKSYLSNEPAVMRAILTDFNPYKQTTARIKSLESAGHKTDKIELIVIGGTFSYLPKQYQTWFIKECFRACNEKNNGAPRNIKKRERKKIASLEELQRENEKSDHRIVGLTLETRPDYINKKEIKRMRKLGATRVELGVQSLYNDILELNKRGHGRSEIIKATRLLKEAGFKINYHMMPNLPGSNYEKDLEMFKELFTNPDFQPDMLKIYPCVIIKSAQIYKWWKKGKHKTYSDKKLANLLCEIKKTIPYYVRIARLIRDIPSTSIIDGNRISNLRQILKEKSMQENWQCKCIRCREIRDNYNLDKKENSACGPKIFRQDYNASRGREIFLSFEDRERKYLYSFLRMRINLITIAEDCLFSKRKLAAQQPVSPSNCCLRVKSKIAIPILENSAIIREVHTYGQAVSINSKDKKSPQHTGLGRNLIAKAERIAHREFNLRKIAVISGVGVRGYYRKLGYRLKDGYMVKSLNN